MKIRHVIGIVLFGIALRYVDTMLELFITYLGNAQAVRATQVQMDIANIMGSGESNMNDSDTVVRGFVDE